MPESAQDRGTGGRQQGERAGAGVRPEAVLPQRGQPGKQAAELALHSFLKGPKEK